MSQYFLRFPNGKAKALTFSYDDGVDSDIRLCKIFKENGLKCTFNLNSGLMNGAKTICARRMTEKECKELFTDPDFEVACHSYTHPFLDKCDPAVALDEIVLDRQKLESMFGREVHGMAYPMGTYNDTVIECCRAADIYYSRTVKSTLDFEMPTEWLTWNPTCRHANDDIFAIADRFLKKTPTKQPWLFYIWGHSYEFNQRNDWDRMENLCKKVGGHNDVWYATNMEIYLYSQAFSRLECSADGHVVHNPTDVELWFVADGRCYSIKSGETIKI